MRVSCPDNCIYLDSGSDYQEKRLAELFMPIRRDFYRQLGELGDDQAVRLFNLIEVITFSYFDGRRDGQDAEVVAALQALRRTLSPLHVPSMPMPVFAGHLKKEFESFKEQNSDQMANSPNAPKVLDQAIQFVSEFSGRDLQSRRFLMGLIGYVKAYHPQIAENLRRKHEMGHILLPGQSFVPSASEPHQYGPTATHQHKHH